MNLAPGEYRVAVNGVELSYTIVGTGPLLFAVSSGWGVGSDYLPRGLAPLAKDLTLVCIATRGSGRSTRPADERAMGTATMADDIEHLRQHLGCGPINLFGHSNGGAIAISYAGRYPEFCSKLVLVDSQLIGFSAAEASRAILAKWADDPRYREALSNFAQPPSFEDEAFSNWLISFFALYFHDPDKNMRKMTATFDLPLASWAAQKQWAADALPSADQTKDVARITAEALVIVGENDFITPVPTAERIRDGIRNSRLAIVRNCGHFPWIEQPEAFFAEVRSFMLGG